MDERKPTEVTPAAERLDKFKADISRDADITDEQREAANEDMRFVNVKGGMWEGFLTNDFKDNRVRMEFDLVSDFLQRYLGKFTLNPVGVEYKPDDGTTSDDDAELLNGIYRADFKNYSGAISTDNGAEEAATCGVGAMLLKTRFEDEEDPENDFQRIEWCPIYNAYSTVMWDQAAKQIDKRDARWCTILNPFTVDSFKAEYPGKDPVSAYTPNTQQFNQNSTSRTPQLVYVAERYEIVIKKESVFVYNNLESEKIETYSPEDHELIKDELRASPAHTFVRERTIMRRTVEKSIFSGVEFLQEPKRIAGKFIPVIPFYAYRAYVDGMEWYRGLVRKLKDPQRTFNVEMSQLAENAASNGQEVPIFLREQMENPGIKDLWANKNNKPYLVVDPVTDDAGNIINAGPIAYNRPGQLDASTTALLSVVPDYVRNVTGGAPQETLNPDASGKAIKALIEREDLSTSKVTKNITDAIVWSGEVYQSMASEIYNSHRVLRTLGKDGKDRTTELSSLTLDEETGKIVESNTILGKKFRSYPDIGPRYDTLREQTVEDLKGMLEAMKDTPAGAQYTPALISVLLANITGVGLDPIKELNRRLMLQQGLIQPENEEDVKMLAAFQQQQQEDNAQEALMKAAALQQQAEARNLDSDSIENMANARQKVADAEKTRAETVQIFADMDNAADKIRLQAEDQRQKQISDFRKNILAPLQSLPLQ